MICALVNFSRGGVNPKGLMILGAGPGAPVRRDLECADELRAAVRVA